MRIDKEHKEEKSARFPITLPLHVDHVHNLYKKQGSHVLHAMYIYLYLYLYIKSRAFFEVLVFFLDAFLLLLL